MFAAGGGCGPWMRTRCAPHGRDSRGNDNPRIAWTWQSQEITSLSKEEHHIVVYNKQFEMIAPVKPTTTLPTCTRTLIRKGVECVKKEVEKKAEKTVKPKHPKQASATAQGSVLKF